MSKFSYKKFHFLLPVVFSIANIFAIPKDPCQKEGVCCEEPKMNPFSFKYPIDTGIVCPKNYRSYAEFLWMKPIEAGLEYAVFNATSVPSDNVTPLLNGNIIEFSKEKDWNPGVRVGFETYLNHDLWSLDATWTYIRIKVDSSHGLPQGNTNGFLLPLYGTTGYPFSSYDIKNASARWSGDLNTLDLKIGKPFYITRYFISKPFFGIRGAWIDQNYHVRYFTDFQTFLAPFTKANVFLKNDFWGVGFRGAYEGSLLLGKNFSIYAKAAFSLLFSKFHISQNTENKLPSNVWDYDLNNVFYRISSNTDLCLGISYSTFFEKNKYKVMINASYEFQKWPEQNKTTLFPYYLGPQTALNATYSDLSFNGFSIGLNVTF